MEKMKHVQKFQQYLIQENEKVDAVYRKKAEILLDLVYKVLDKETYILDKTQLQIGFNRPYGFVIPGEYLNDADGQEYYDGSWKNLMIIIAEPFDTKKGMSTMLQNKNQIFLFVLSPTDYRRDLKQRIEENEDVLIHETIHYLDRKERKIYYGSASNKKDMSAYYNSDIEYNAYYQQFIYVLEKMRTGKERIMYGTYDTDPWFFFHNDFGKFFKMLKKGVETGNLNFGSVNDFITAIDYAEIVDQKGKDSKYRHFIKRLYNYWEEKVKPMWEKEWKEYLS